MSTRSVIARPTATGWHGNYVHFDGVPYSRLPKLAAGYRHFRGNVDAMATYLIDQHPAGWASLGHEWQLKAGYVEYANMPKGDDGYADESTPDYRRNKCLCHGDSDNAGSGHHATGDDLGGIEYVYVLHDSHVEVLRWGTEPTGRFSWDRIATIATMDDPSKADDVTAAGCGANFEFCSHYAWAHFDEVDRASRLSTGQWLGNDPIGIDEATAVIIDGVRWNLGFSGRMRHDGVWTSSATRADTGEKRDLPVRKHGRDGWEPLPNVTYILPATAHQPEQTLAPSTV